MTEMNEREKCWSLAEKLFTRWHSMHGLSEHEKAWQALDEWDREYWYGVAEYVLDNYKEKS